MHSLINYIYLLKQYSGHKLISIKIITIVNLNNVTSMVAVLYGKLFLLKVVQSL